jgi:putative flippase GtrA
MNIYLKFISFCFIGATAALIDLVSFNIFFWFGINFIICRILAITLALFYVFTMNRNITFVARIGKKRHQIPKFLLVYSITISVSLLVSWMTIKFLGENVLNANIASIFGIISGIPLSFFGSLLWTFKIRKLSKFRYPSHKQQSISTKFPPSATDNFSLFKSSTTSCRVLNPDLKINKP